MSEEKLLNNLLWEKYRPTTMEDIVLLPRIRDIFKDGLKQHVLLYGKYGCGKTSIGRILGHKYIGDCAYLEINASLETSIDVLRTKVDDFCSVKSMFTTNPIKYVFLDEFDGTSIQFQDAFKAFIEKYNKNVRFIITTNHISKISDGVKSRLLQVNFDCQNRNEEKQLKQLYYDRITKVILPNENLNIDKKIIVEFVNKNFPDFRNILVDIDNYRLTGNLIEKSSNVAYKQKTELYELIYNESLTYIDIYNYIMSNFGADKIDLMIRLLSTDFIEYSISENKNIEKLFKCNYIISDYANLLYGVTDPIVLGMSIIGKFRDILLD